jgi:acylphosphatase
VLERVYDLSGVALRGPIHWGWGLFFGGGFSISIMQVHVFYSGHVQGVGFRYTVQEAAQRRRLKGWVRNLRDGRVEAVLTGDTRSLHIFLEAMLHGPLGENITDADLTWNEKDEAFDGFEVRETV